MRKSSGRYLLHLAIAAPFTLATIFLIVWLAFTQNISLSIGALLLGALGWWVALLLRLPALLVAQKSSQKTGQLLVVLTSGPAEESVRLILLAIIGLSVGNAVSVAIGWAAIEIIYGIIQAIAIGVLTTRSDKKAMEAKALMKTMGMDSALKPSAPYWGILERISANFLHLFFSLALVISPWLILLTAPLHSLTNLTLVTLLKRSMALGQIVLFIISIILIALIVL